MEPPWTLRFRRWIARHHSPRLSWAYLALGGALLLAVELLLPRGVAGAAEIAFAGAGSVLLYRALGLTRRGRRELEDVSAARDQLSVLLRQQEAVARLGQLTLTDIGEEDLLQIAADLVADRLQADGAAVLERAADRSELVERAVCSRVLPTRAQTTPTRVSAPIGLDGSAYGVLVAHRQGGREFTTRDVHFVHAVANVLGSSIRRRVAETEQRRTHALFTAMVEGTSDAVFIKDLEGRFMHLNDACAARLGSPRAAIVGRTVYDLLGRDEADAMTDADRRVVAAGVPQAFEESTTVGGRRSVSLATKGPVYDDAGRVVALFGIARDITSRKEEELALTRSEERLRLALEGARMGTWEIDLVAGEHVWSDSLYAVFGVEAGSGIEHDHYLGFVHPEDRERVGFAIAEAISRGEGYEDEHRIVRPDGQLRWILGRATVLFDEDGRPARVLGVATDLTERKLAEQELARNQTTLDLAEKVAGMGAWTMHVDSRTFDLTPGMFDLFGLDPGTETTAELWYSLVHEADRERVKAVVREAVATGSAYEDEFRAVSGDGRQLWLETRGSVIRDEAGAALRLVGVTMDVTDRRQAEEDQSRLEVKLRQAERMEAVGQLAGGIAHDFNNLLLALRGYGELALRRIARNEDGADLDVREMLEAADRAAGLTRQLLAFGRRQVLNPEVLDLAGVVADLDEEIRRAVGEKVELVAIPPAEPVLVKADRGQVAQVITNLAENARDAMPNGGRLTIGVSTAQLDPSLGAPAARDGLCAVLTVTDTGTGMDAETSARIFEPFFSTKQEKGRGLGLATVHGIVTQSGGHLGVYTAVGKGTAFEVYLPLSEDRVAEQTLLAPAAAVEPDSGESILLIEDDANVRSIVQMMLEDRGYSVLSAGGGEDAIALLEEHGAPVHLALSDLIMRGLNGRETVERLRERQPSLRVLYMSGYTDDAVVRGGGLNAGTGFIQKPFSGEELGRRIRELLDLEAAA